MFTTSQSRMTTTMSTTEPMHEPLKTLTLPPGLDDVTGLVEIDMSAIVQVMSDHAQQQYLLSRHQADKFRRQLWNRLADVLNDVGGNFVTENN
jgi:hypothetical protein